MYQSIHRSGEKLWALFFLRFAEIFNYTYNVLSNLFYSFVILSESLFGLKWSRLSIYELDEIVPGVFLI